MERSLETRACPRCGDEVSYEARGPGVAVCAGCGAELGFSPGQATGDDRVALADRTVPAESRPPNGAPTISCWNCAAPVPLRGATPAEQTGTDPGDIADTLTCPACGVEIPPAESRISR